MIIQDPTLGELAKILDPLGWPSCPVRRRTRPSVSWGTLAYASPEQMEGPNPGQPLRHLQLWSHDVSNAHGAICHYAPVVTPLADGTKFISTQCRSRSPTFWGENAVPQKLLEDVVMQCLAKRPEEIAPQQVRDILNALEPLESRFVPGAAD